MPIQLVNPGRFLDGFVFAIFATVLACGALFVMAQGYERLMALPAVTQYKKVVAVFLPFGSKLKYDLTHVLLVAVLIVLLAMQHHPAQEAINKDFEAKLRAKANKEKETKKAA